MLKIGVLGAGHLGKIHLNCIKQLPVYELIGFYDQDNNTSKKVSEDLQVKCFSSTRFSIESNENCMLGMPEAAFKAPPFLSSG